MGYRNSYYFADYVRKFVGRFDWANDAPVPGDDVFVTDEETIIRVLGDATLARETLGWSPRISFRELVEEMVTHDLRLAREEALLDRDRAGD